MPRQLTTRGRERRRQLLDHAARRFAEHGYHTTSVADIVDGVGVGKGVFYWYFESKEQLFLEVLDEALDDLRRTQVVAMGDEPDPLKRVEISIRTGLAWIHGNRAVLDLFQLAATDERFAPALALGKQRAAEELAHHLKDAIVAGRIADGDPDVLAVAILGVIEALAGTYLTSGGGWDERAADTAVAFCLGGLWVTPPNGDSSGLA